MKAKRITALLLVLSAAAMVIWRPLPNHNVEAVAVQSTDRTPAAEVRLQKPIEGGKLTQAAENDRLILYFDHQSGGIAVKDKASGTLFYSNPPNALQDPKASDETKQNLMSQVRVKYTVKGKEGDLEMNSYAQALKLNQLNWGKLENGLRVEMTIGREEQRRLLPQQITKASFEKEIIAAMDTERKKKQIQAFYILYTQDQLAGDEGKALLAKYPALKKEDIYILKSSVTERDKNMLEENLKSAGYTYDKLNEEYTKLGFKGDNASFPSFKMIMDYVLKDTGLSVSLDAGAVQYDKEHFSLTGISLLNFFGAGQGSEQGYLFLPDGSGTLIDFNKDGSKKTLLTTGKVYGPDDALSQRDRGSSKQEFRVPVFGIKKGNSALFSVIEDGDAAAEISGVMGDIDHSWNTAYASFTIRNQDWFIQKGAIEQAPWILYEKNAYTGRIAMQYFFLTGNQANYVGMAHAYQQYLVAQGALKKEASSPHVPFYLDTMGSVDMIVRKLGIPMNSQVPITTFEEAGQMLNELNAGGVENIKLRYTGWYNGGYYHTAAAKMKVEGELGGAKGLKQLAGQVKRAGAELFPDVDLMYVSSNQWFDGFAPKQDAIRSLFQKIGFHGMLNPANLEVENSQWAVDPHNLLPYYKRFSKAYSTLGIQGMSLSTLGEGLNSNFKQKNEVNRQQSRMMSTEVLKQADADYGQVISDRGNAYILPYVDHILNLPEEDSSFTIADRQVPFLQIALHGYVQYAGEALNLKSDLRSALLKALEYGSGVYFKLNYGENSILKEALLTDQVNAFHYKDWKQTAIDAYKEINSVLGDVQDQAITNHEQLAEKVFRTTYENGKTIVVNYGDIAYKAAGTEVGPMDFTVIKP